MIRFTATIKQFEEAGEKTGWTYIEIPFLIADSLMSGNKKAFRVKGLLDDYPFEKVSLLPMGGGCFLMALNSTIRKKLRKTKGDLLHVSMEVDDNELIPPPVFIECLEDEPSALAFFNHLPKAHRHYYIKWLQGVKGEEAKARRIAKAVTALSKQQDFGQMIRSLRGKEIG